MAHNAPEVPRPLDEQLGVPLVGDSAEGSERDALDGADGVSRAAEDGHGAAEFGSGGRSGMALSEAPESIPAAGVEEMCAICRCELREDPDGNDAQDVRIEILQCLHRFHTVCIEEVVR
ncbi:unnamed protein product, partial [Prorocentrum cordatum]